MKQFLSILYVQTNAAASEKLAIALFLVTPQKIWFKADKQKLTVAEKLCSFGADIQIATTLKLLEQSITNENLNLTGLAGLPDAGIALHSSSYFEYLYKYTTTSLLSYGQPLPYTGPCSEADFQMLYQTLVAPMPITSRERTNTPFFYQRIRKTLETPGVRAHADINFTLTRALIPGLLTDQHLELASKNGSILTIQAQDFNRSIESLSKKLYSYEVTVRALDAFDRKYSKAYQKGTFVLLFNRPEPGSPQEQLLNNVYGSKQELFALEELAYLSELEHKLAASDYQPFSLFLSNMRQDLRRA